MKKLLFVNVCTGEQSRTLRLCRHFLSCLKDFEVEEIALFAEVLRPMDATALAERDACLKAGDFGHPCLRYARQFAEADFILIGAPYWDLSFPAALKIYLERVSANGVVFRYDEHGVPHGLCKAERLVYITTSGGHIGPFDTGWRYVEGLTGALYGIPARECVAAEGLDIWGNDVEAILKAAEVRLEELTVGF